MTPPLRHPPLRPEWIDRPHRILPLGGFGLESGVIVADAHLSYVTHGHLNQARDNAVLILPAIGATHHRLDFLIGSGKAMDPAQYFIICVDALGNGLSSSPSNSLEQAGMLFPRFNIRDLVQSQAMLLDALGIDRLHAVCGASMGGMQALQWGVSHPDRVGKIVAMTPMTKTAAWSRAVNELSRQSLLLDPAWNGESFTDAPKRGFALWAGIMRVLASRTPDALAHAVPNAHDTAAYLRNLGVDSATNGPDPIDWIYQTWAYDSHDVGETPGFDGGVEVALGRIKGPTLMLAPTLDLYNPAGEARRAASLIRNGVLVEIPSIEGHQSASGVDPADTAFLIRTIAAFLAEA